MDDWIGQLCKMAMKLNKGRDEMIPNDDIVIKIIEPHFTPAELNQSN